MKKKSKYDDLYEVIAKVNLRANLLEQSDARTIRELGRLSKKVEEMFDIANMAVEKINECKELLDDDIYQTQFYLTAEELELVKILAQYARHRLTKHHNSGLKKCTNVGDVEDLMFKAEELLDDD